MSPAIRKSYSSHDPRTRAGKAQLAARVQAGLERSSATPHPPPLHAGAVAEPLMRLRAATPPLERERVLQRLADPVLASFGWELEIGIEISPSVPRGSLLAMIAGTRVETDTMFKSRKSDLEFVTRPDGGAGHALSAAQAQVDFIETLRAHCRKTGASVATLGELYPDCSPEFKGHKITLTSAFPLGSLQVTAGVKLEKFGGFLQKRAPSAWPEVSRRRNLVLQSLRSECDRLRARGEDIPTQMSPRVIGFIELLMYYQVEAGGPGNEEGTVHGIFRAMMRSDFCAVYRQLLKPEDRQFARMLLLPPDGDDKQGNLLMNALGQPFDQLVFAKPYMAGPEKTHPGPAMLAFHQSIVHGVGNGEMEKDALSPPPGYPPQIRDAELKQYGMGRFGVDPELGAMLFEMRVVEDAIYQVPVNRSLPLVIEMERRRMREFNDAGIGPASPLRVSGPDAKEMIMALSINRYFHRYLGELQKQFLLGDQAALIAQVAQFGQLQANLIKAFDQDYPSFKAELGGGCARMADLCAELVRQNLAGQVLPKARLDTLADGIRRTIALMWDHTNRIADRYPQPGRQGPKMTAAGRRA